MLQAQPFHEIQITALCKKAGIPRKAFYRYFDAKEDIITFLVENMFHVLLMQQAPPIQDHPSALRHCTLFFRYWMERPALLNALARTDTIGMFYGDFMNYAIKHDVFTPYTPEPALQDRISAILSTSSLFHLLLHWYVYKVPQTAEELGDIYYHYLTKPLYQPPEK